MNEKLLFSLVQYVTLSVYFCPIFQESQINEIVIR